MKSQILVGLLWLAAVFSPSILPAQYIAAEFADLDARLAALENLEERIASIETIDARLAEFDSLQARIAELERAASKPQKESGSSSKKWYEKLAIRGYTQLRFSTITHLEPGSAAPQHAGDSSISNDRSFLLRRARMILYGDVTDHLYVYIQPDFAVTPPGSPDSNHFVQLRDWYADVYVDRDKEYRFRLGQSKVPYGWENLQSSSNRVYHDRNDAFNSATRNERDLGVFFYWTPTWAQEMFEAISDANLKHSGNYGVFGIGAYNGQGGSFNEQNDAVHLVARLNLPFEINCQYMEVGIQGFTGDYVVLGSPIRPLGMGGADITPIGTKTTGSPEGQYEQRFGGTFIYYPQPLGFQAEWTVGNGPGLSDDQTRIERRDLNGGYVMMLYKHETEDLGTFFPFIRWQHFRGGYRSFRNAPYAIVDEVNCGFEWQIRKELELQVEYGITDRTNLNAISSSSAVSSASYNQFDGQFLRFQMQVNY